MKHRSWFRKCRTYLDSPARGSGWGSEAPHRPQGHGVIGSFGVRRHSHWFRSMTGPSFRRSGAVDLDHADPGRRGRGGDPDDPVA